MDDRYLVAGIGLVAVLLIGVILSTAPTNESSLSFGQQKAAIISLSGSITSSSNTFGSQSISAETVREANSQAISRGASAIIYEWNSGGGAVVASKEVKREIESVEVPTVCRFRDVAASGAYLASLGCDRIVADSASITGSIGVISSYLEYSGLMEKLGIDYVNITAGRYKDVGSPYRNATDEEKQILEEKTEIIHEEFVSEVRNERNLTESETEDVITGEIFLGTEAEDLGLVDRLGGRSTAVKTAENLTDSELSTFEIQSRQQLNLLSILSADTFFGNSFSNSAPLKASWR